MKYLVLWEWDISKMPADKGQQQEIMQRVMGTTKQYFKEHPGEEWGGFVGGSTGYWLGATNWQDINRIRMAFSPYFKVQVHQAVSLEEYDAFYNSMMQMQPK